MKIKRWYVSMYFESTSGFVKTRVEEEKLVKWGYVELYIKKNANIFSHLPLKLSQQPSDSEKIIF